MKIYDISAIIKEDIVTYNNEDKPIITKLSQLDNNDSCNVTQITLNVHTATHADACNHFINDGQTIAEMSLIPFMGTAKVFELQGIKLINKAHLEKLDINPQERILFKTTQKLFLDHTFNYQYTALSIDAADYLVEKQVLLVGIDSLSIENSDNQNHLVHKTLLKNNIAILEGLVLDEVEAGVYELIALPLKIANSDGSPVRAILRSIH